LKPGLAITVEAGSRNRSLSVRVGTGESVRLSQALAAGISVVAGSAESGA